MNRLLLEARVVEHGARRWTPAGIPALDLQLEHDGPVEEAGQVRQVRLRLKAIAFGGLVERLQSLGLGQAAVFAGFLAAAGRGHVLPPPGVPSRGITFHVTGLEPTAIAV